MSDFPCLQLFCNIFFLSSVYTSSINPKIQYVSFCAHDLKEWKNRAGELTCGSPVTYHCLQTEHGQLIELCAATILVTTRDICPYVKIAETSDVHVNIGLRNCTQEQLKCPDKDYFTDQLYEYPGCFGNRSRMQQINNRHTTKHVTGTRHTIFFGESSIPYQFKTVERSRSSDQSLILASSTRVQITDNLTAKSVTEIVTDVTKRAVFDVLKIAGIVAALPCLSAVTLLVVKLCIRNMRRMDEANGNLEGTGLPSNHDNGSIYDEIEGVVEVRDDSERVEMPTINRNIGIIPPNLQGEGIQLQCHDEKSLIT